MAVSVADVEALSSMGWSNLDAADKKALLEDAKSEKDTIYSERVATLPTIEGDEDIFVKNLAAHKWELAEGGEAQSENAAGGSVNYNTVTGEVFNYLSETRYGRTAMEHLRNKAQIGFVRTW